MKPELRMQFLEGMSRAATFVAVVTTDGEAGRFGVTISSLTSVSADGDHPSLLACLHHMSPVAAAILKNRAFCANLLHEDQHQVSDLFDSVFGTSKPRVLRDLEQSNDSLLNVIPSAKVSKNKYRII